MADTLCGYPDREDALVTYLYGDMDEASRVTFDAHLAICARCRHEIATLRDARGHLAAWQAPQPVGIVVPPPAAVAPAPPRTTWRTLPVWVQVAAAMLVLGASAGVANLDVHYDQHGLAIRTGWMTPAAAPAPAAAAREAAPWRTDLTALEQQLRSEFRAASAAAVPVAAVETPRAASASDAELLKKVRALLEASEKRQQNELALRAAEIMTNVRAQRNADMIKIDSAIDAVQAKTNSRLLKQNATIGYLVSATQRQ
jgi:anti-sigma factor RsiW